MSDRKKVELTLFSRGTVLSKLIRYAQTKDLSKEEVIDSLIDDWEGGADGVIRSIREGDFENFLDAELEAYANQH